MVINNIKRINLYSFLFNTKKKPSEIISKGYNHKPIHRRRIDLANLQNHLVIFIFFRFFYGKIKKIAVFRIIIVVFLQFV